MNPKLFCSIAALVCCSAIFAKAPPKAPPPKPALDQGNILTNDRYPPAYNAPAKIDLTNRTNYNWPYSFFIDTSFIYWNASQDGMELGSSDDLISYSITPNKKSVDFHQPFTYSPGFTVGLGFGFQDWELHAKYLWIRHRSSISSNAPRNYTAGGTPVWVTYWFAQGVGAENEYLTATHVASSWRLGIDLGDLTAGRPYYQSKIVTISPFGGIRAAWIRQSLHVRAKVPAAASATSLVPQPTHSHNRTDSWGVGPVIGADGHCLLGLGFRFEANGGFSVLFTQYPTLFHKENWADTRNISIPPISLFTTNYNCLRPMANLGLGFGWGQYLYNNYHIDFAADYDFNVFWNQNMLRKSVGEAGIHPMSSENLYLHGLTITGRFDF